MKKIISLIVGLVIMLLSTVGALAVETVSTTVQEADLFSLNGAWQGTLPVFMTNHSYFNDPIALDVNAARNNQILLRMDSIDKVCYQPPSEWVRSAEGLQFSLYEGVGRIDIALTLQPDGSLTGICTQRGREMPLSLQRSAAQPAAEGALPTQFIFERKTEGQWLEELRATASYSATGTPIPYTYELSRPEKSRPISEMYGLDSITSGHTDLETMKILLDLISQNFMHDGSVVLPQPCDALSVIAYHNQHGGIECRGLSVILSEMLRVCGIPAKPIMCIPSSEPCEDCHVVVHAYSQSLGQWVLLDPSYHLMLHNEAGVPISLPMLRDALIRGERLVPNEDAGRNGLPFSLPWYRAYMTKNVFRFANATDFYFGGERFADTDLKGRMDVSASSLFGGSSSMTGRILQRPNPQNMLVPLAYVVPYRYSRTERLTTCATRFWAVPGVNNH
ncbi:MAG: transglutaminase-like domain-containing protein [Oscillospiraceae bacterium]